MAGAAGEDDPVVRLAGPDWARAILDDCADAVCLLRPVRDADGAIVDFAYEYFNEAAVMTDKIGRDEHLRGSLVSLFPRLSGTDLLARFVDVVETGAAYAVKGLHYRDASGRTEQTRVFDVSAARVGSGLRLIYRDVTGVDEAADQLRHSTLMLESSPNPIVIQTLDGVVTGWNPPAERAYGYRAQEVIGAPVTILEPPDRAGEMMSLLGRLAHAEHIEQFETVRLAKDGRRIDVSLTIVPTRFERGRVAAVATMATDITGRRHIEQALRVSEAYNRGLIEASLDGLIAVDQDLIITDVNESMCRLTGHSRDELLTTSFPEHFTDPQRAADGVRAALALGSVTEYELTTAHGQPRLVSFNAATYIDPATGERGGIFAAARDITARRRAEAEVLRLNEERRDDALATASAKSEFLATMSHEIRTPMNGVIGLTGLLLQTQLDDTQRRYAQGAAAATNSLMTILSDVLDISKIESGRLELASTEFALGDVVEDVVDVVIQSARAKGITVSSFISPDLPPTLIGDPVRIRQILLNLLDNAVKYTDRGGVSVIAEPEVSAVDARPDRSAVDTHPAGTGTMEVRLDVTDTGVGIAEADIRRLFARFSQARPSATQRGGSGLGLAISRQLANAMHGDLAVQSQVGVGSTFTATVRLGVTTPWQPSIPPASVAGRRALVVDADRLVATTISRYLDGWGLVTRTATSMIEARQLVAMAVDGGSPTDVVILDEETSAIEGGVPSLAQTPTIVLSHTAPTAAGRWMGNVRQVLQLPVRRTELLDSIVRIFAGGEPAAAEAAAPSNVDGGDGGRADGKGRILVAEDNEINQMVAVGILRRLGYEVDVAANGRQVIDAVGEHPYQLVLMDILMPDVDGYQATRELRGRQDGARHLPIVAMTAAAMPEDRDRCLAAGMDDIVVKPFTPAQLSDIVAKWARSPAS